MCIRRKGKESNEDANARVKTKVGISYLMNIEEKVLLKLTRLSCLMMRLKNSISNSVWRFAVAVYRKSRVGRRDRKIS